MCSQHCYICVLNHCYICVLIRWQAAPMTCHTLSGGTYDVHLIRMFHERVAVRYYIYIYDIYDIHMRLTHARIMILVAHTTNAHACTDPTAHTTHTYAHTLQIPGFWNPMVKWFNGILF